MEVIKLEEREENEKRTARSYDVYGIACGIGSIILPCYGVLLALAAILLGIMAVQENQKIGGIAAIVLGSVGIIWSCLAFYGLMRY